MKKTTGASQTPQGHTCMPGIPSAKSQITLAVRHDESNGLVPCQRGTGATMVNRSSARTGMTHHTAQAQRSRGLQTQEQQPEPWILHGRTGQRRSAQWTPMSAEPKQRCQSRRTRARRRLDLRDACDVAATSCVPIIIPWTQDNDKATTGGLR